MTKNDKTQICGNCSSFYKGYCKTKNHPVPFNAVAVDIDTDCFNLRNEKIDYEKGETTMESASLQDIRSIRKKFKDLNHVQSLSEIDKRGMI
jgi:hypothetical protein